MLRQRDTHPQTLQPASPVLHTCCCTHTCAQTEDGVTAAKLKAAAGLAHLDGRRYKQAARAFVDVSPELGTTYSDVRRVLEGCVCVCVCVCVCLSAVHHAAF
jgi:hypothetical protein